MVFVDTSAWIALTDKSDQYHHEASAIYTKLKLKKARFLTADYVLDEAITRLRYDVSHTTALKFIELIEKSEKQVYCKFIRLIRRYFRKQLRSFVSMNR